MDTRVSYGSQDNALMRSVKKEVCLISRLSRRLLTGVSLTQALKRMPFLRIQYEDGWPVIFYLKRSLKGGHPRKGRKQVVVRFALYASSSDSRSSTGPPG